MYAARKQTMEKFKSGNTDDAALRQSVLRGAFPEQSGDKPLFAEVDMNHAFMQKTINFTSIF